MDALFDLDNKIEVMCSCFEVRTVIRPKQKVISYKNDLFIVLINFLMQFFINRFLNYAKK